MISLPSPKTLLYPTDYITRDVTWLQVQLRRLRRRFTRGGLTKDQLRQRGVDIIRTSYARTIEQLNKYFIKYGLLFGVTTMEPELQRCQTDAILGWMKIVDDL